MNSMETIRKCPQLIIYIILSVISAIFTYILSFDTFNKLPQKFKITMIVTNLVVFMGMSLLYFWLCSIGYKTTAWLILLVPIFCSVIFSLFVNGAAHQKVGDEYEEQGGEEKANMDSPVA